MIYDVKSKCIKLLDDGSGRDPLEEYNFGSAANYLFRPCTNDAGEEEVSHTQRHGSLENAERKSNAFALVKGMRYHTKE